MAITINGTGTITGISAGGLPDGVITSDDLASGAITAAGLPAGSILQVVQATKTDTTSTSSTSWSDISGLSVSITPASASNKILVRYDCTVGAAAGNWSGGIKLLRGATDIFLGDTAGSRTRATSWIWSGSTHYPMWQASNEFLDSPATTSSVTYKLQFMSAYSGTDIYINSSYTDSDNSTRGRVPSQITVMEVAA
jgi:hypothetical protein